MAFSLPNLRHTRWVGGSVVGLLLLGAAAPAAAQPWGSRLFPSTPNKRWVILHADDIGMAPGANAAAADLVSEDLIQSVSAMVPLDYFVQTTPDADSVVKWFNDNPTVDVGLHFTLTNEWPKPDNQGGYRWGPTTHPPCDVKWVLKRKFLFWGCTGRFPKSQLALWFYSARHTVRKELAAQTTFAISQFNQCPTHLDSHMGTAFVKPSYFRKYIQLARDARIPATTFEDFRGTYDCMLRSNWQSKATKRLLGERLKRVQQQEAWPFPRIDRYCSLPDGQTAREVLDNLKADILALPPGTITQYYFHPVDDVPASNPGAPIPDSAFPGRHEIEQNMLYLKDDGDPTEYDWKEFLAANGIETTTWKEIHARCVAEGICDPAYAPGNCAAPPPP